MAKRNTPDGKKPPGADVAEPAKPRRGFISDFDMWDMSLDITGANSRESASTKPAEPTKAVPPKKSPPKPSAVASRAKTTPIKPRATQHQAMRQKPQQGANAVANGTRTRPVPVAGPAAARPSSQAGATRQRRSDHDQTFTATRPVPPVRDPQPDRAVFTTRNINQRIVPQDVNRVEELKKKRKREKVLKSTSWLWAMVIGVWSLVTKLVKLLIKLIPVAYHHKALVGASVVSFVLGVLVGSLDLLGSDSAPVEKPTSTSLSSSTEHKPRVAKATRKPRHAPKPKTRPAAPIRSAEPPRSPPVAASGNTDEAQSLASNQFSGKDIPLASVDTNDATLQDNGADQPTETAEPSQAGQGDVAGESPLSNDTQASMVSTPPPDSSGQNNDAAFKHLLDLNVGYFNQKAWQQVVSTSQQILALKPFTEAALINRSAAYTELGEYALAIEDANTLIAMNRKNGVAFNNRAYAYEKAGTVGKAITDYTKACQLGIKQSCADMKRLINAQTDSH